MAWVGSFLSRARRWTFGAGRAPLGVVLCAALLGASIGMFGFGQNLEDGLRSVRNLLRQHDASGQVVVIAIDDKSINELQRWPWPRRYHAQLIENLADLGARRIFFDIEFSSESNPKDDAILAATLARLKHKVVLANVVATDPMSESRSDIFPIPQFRSHAAQGNINLAYRANGSVWKIPYGMEMEGVYYPSFAASLAGYSVKRTDFFQIDHAIKPDSIPAISAADIITGAVPRSAVQGKDVVIGAASMQLGDIFNAPGYGLISGVYLHVLGAETLLKGIQVPVGWPVLLAIMVAVMILTAARYRGKTLLAVYILLPPLLVGVATLLENSLVVPTIVPAIAAAAAAVLLQSVLVVADAIAQRGRINPVSGLPNLKALRDTPNARDQFLIAMRVHNYPGIVSSLTDAGEARLVEQIAARLTVGGGASAVFQSDDGIFMTLAHKSDPVEDHASALHTIFRQPFVVGEARFDLIVSFGVDGGFERPMSSRFGTAVMAADEALRAGSKWKVAEIDGGADSAWQLSLLGQLDEAIELGHLWVAYQPKIDLRSNEICGVEALVRWAHPERGNISPIEFIEAAERSGRIDRLTEFVLRTALSGAAALAARGHHIDLAVNLSARMLTDESFPNTLGRLLETHGIPPARLILEVTETAAIDDESLSRLDHLRAMGVGLSVDDYGTGLSTLEYLRRIPAAEIKIDKTFVQSLATSQSDRLMVNSTIHLAHALGRRVVAEGVEDGVSLENLRKMGCDAAQGFFIGRPMTLPLLYRTLNKRVGKRAA